MHIIDSITGLPHANNVIVFNGDMVDRGSNSCEIFLAVCALKVHAPKYVAVNRGNHEAFGMGVHGFTNEALGKYDMETYELFQHCFRVLPLVRFFTFASCASPTLACPRAYIVAVSFFFCKQATVLCRHTIVLHGGLGNWDAVRTSSIVGAGA